MFTTQRIRTLAAALGLPLLAACGGVLESSRPPVQTWWLEATHTSAESADGPRTGLALEVGVVPGLDTDLVLTLNPDGRLNHYAGARWPEHLPELLGSLVRRSLENSGLYRQVHGHGFTTGDECELDIEAQAFWSRVDRANASTSVEVRFAGSHICGEQRWPVRHAASVPVNGNRMPEIVAAYQNALDRVMRDLVKQLEGQGPAPESSG